MAFDYNAARANRFAKRHRKVAAKLTEPIESELAKTKEANEALTAANAELEKAKSEAAEAPAETAKSAKATKKKG